MPQITLTRDNAQQLVDFCKKHSKDEFFLAKDRGAYVGSAATVDGKLENCLFYFKDCHPEKDANYRDNQTALFGRDDFGEDLPVSALTECLALPGIISVTIKVTSSSIKFLTKTRS